ncbi:excinuclease ABC subunit C [[Mycoplasma] falconis]|uniref:Excinuclease ABC subunit C n=1 Tax=[Mycoplasma] falconis TaxID=92403 RepID=A0A501X9M0_9BACT|nr:excinuclease ABC subunit UvrC [[Mycoplasma] falconis]TPE57278.1 excinuclease ABC subunit C [[Mycoplasma] falconis]
MISKDLIKDVPNKPGVYLWKNKDNQIIYIGKAKNLKNRMSQYFDKKMFNSYKTPQMLENITSFETIITQSEREALIEERKLINKHKPFYNVLIPTQSSFPYIRIKPDIKELKIEIVNQYKTKKDAIYYGPLPNNKDFKPLIIYLKHLLLSKDGILIKNQSKEFIKEKFEEAKKIMKFGLIFKKDLEAKIEKANKALFFEQAKFYHSILDLLNYNKQEQNIFINSNKSIDVFAFYQVDEFMLIHILNYRDGALINQRDITLKIKTFDEFFIEEFLDQFYETNPEVDQIILDNKYDFLNFDFRENIVFANNTFEKSLIAKAYDNAKNNEAIKLEKFKDKYNKTILVNENLAAILGINTNRIVMFDNSFLKGTKEIIGGAVYFENGLPNKKYYRYYNLNFEMSRYADVEFIYHSALNYLKENSAIIDLIICDGGEQQIKEVNKVLTQLKLNIALYGLVKDDRHETKYLMDNDGNVIQIKDQDVFNYLAYIQTEADRFARSKYLKKHQQNMLNNPLLKIKGIGPKTLDKLLNHFKTYENIIKASFEELKEVANEKVAELIKQNF